MKPFYLLIAIFSIIGCKDTTAPQSPQNITQIEDYKDFLQQDEQDYIKSIQQDIHALQEQVGKDSTRIVVNSQIAGKLDQLFNLTGNVKYLNKSVRLRESITRNTYLNKEESMRTLAQSYIKQHKFKEADQLMSSFTQKYSSGQSKLIQFDIAMELGNYSKADSLLVDLRDINDYNYLIRAAKWNDYKGQLKTTIQLMERALKIARESGQQSRTLWSYSNLADYYGHDGQLEKSYEYYLNTLQVDPLNTYALKGIAWIAFSHDRDVKEAQTILKTLKKRHPSPDYDLLLADLAAFQGDKRDAQQLAAAFMNSIDTPDYGAMYNTYKIELLIDAGMYEKALQLASTELENRATPETHDLYSYALLSAGRKKEALKHQQEYVVGKTYEPMAQMHTALIYKENGILAESARIKEELLDAQFELGPIIFEKIQSL